jgi:hypothetical protein
VANDQLTERSVVIRDEHAGDQLRIGHVRADSETADACA